MKKMRRRQQRARAKERKRTGAADEGPEEEESEEQKGEQPQPLDELGALLPLRAAHKVRSIDLAPRSAGVRGADKERILLALQDNSGARRRSCRGAVGCSVRVWPARAVVVYDLTLTEKPAPDVRPRRPRRLPALTARCGARAGRAVRGGAPAGAGRAPLGRARAVLLLGRLHAALRLGLGGACARTRAG